MFLPAWESERAGVTDRDIQGGSFQGGVALLTAAGAGGVLNNAPHPNAAKLAMNWLLSREGQIAFQKNYVRETGAADSFRIDIPKDNVPSEFRGKEGIEYIDPKPVCEFYSKLWTATAKVVA